jgi:hypothetical protein
LANEVVGGQTIAEVFLWIRNQGSLHELGVVLVLTGEERASDVEELAERGCYEVLRLQKP